MNMKTRISIFFKRCILMAAICLPIALNAQSDYLVIGSATYSGNDYFMLTPDEWDKRGAVWYQHCILLDYDFEMNFQVYLGDKDNMGADGIAFVLQTNNTNLGSGGVGLGYEGIMPSLAVEYDTFINFDPEYDHIAMHENGVVTWNGLVAGPVPASAVSDNIEDGGWHSTRITWDAESFSLSVYFDDILRLTYTDDIVTNIFGGNPQVYWGFTGSTGGFNNLQQFCVTDILYTGCGLNISKTDVSCFGANDGTASVISIIGGTEPFTFNGWYNGSSLVSMNPSVTGLAPGSYTASHTDADLTTFSRSITIHEPPVLTFSFDVNNECNGNITISAAGGTPPYLYSDDGGQNFQVFNVFNAEAPGSYTLLVKDANACLSPAATAIVTITNPLGLETVTTPASSGCNGSVTLTPDGGTAPYTIAEFAHTFSGDAINTGLFAIRNGLFSMGTGSLRGDQRQKQDLCMIIRLVPMNYSRTNLVKRSKHPLSLMNVAVLCGLDGRMASL